MIRFAPQVAPPSATPSRSIPATVAAHEDGGRSATTPIAPLLIPELELSETTSGKAAKPRAARKPKVKTEAAASELDLNAAPLLAE